MAIKMKIISKLHKAKLQKTEDGKLLLSLLDSGIKQEQEESIEVEVEEISKTAESIASSNEIQRGLMEAIHEPSDENTFTIVLKYLTN